MQIPTPPIAWLPLNTPTARAGGIKASPVYRILVRNPSIAHRFADVGKAFDAADPALLSGYHNNLFNGGTFARAVAGSSTQQSVPNSTRQEVVRQSADGTRFERAQTTTTRDAQGRSSTVDVRQQKIVITAEAWKKMQRHMDQWDTERNQLANRISTLEQQRLVRSREASRLRGMQQRAGGVWVAFVGGARSMRREVLLTHSHTAPPHATSTHSSSSRIRTQLLLTH